MVCAMKDKKISKNNTSGVRGVSYDRFRQKWIARIGFKGRNYYLGKYDKKSDAVDARIMAEKKLFENFLDWYATTYPEQWKRINKTKISSDKIENPKENVYQKYKDYNMDKLSEKQVRILGYRISGLNCHQISKIENVSEKTIANTLYYIKTKLDDDQQLKKLRNYQHDYYVRNNKTYKRENNTNRNIHYLHNLYYVMIVVNYKQYYIKCFKNIEDAIKMRDYVEKIRDKNKNGFDEWYNDFVKNGREVKY